MVRKSGQPYADHPIVQYVRSLPEEYYLTREVCEQVGCSHSMLLYLQRRSPTPLGATHRVRYGAVSVHLYTAARVAAIKHYLDHEVTRVDQGNRRRGQTVIWTKTELIKRRRAKDRARQYHQRAIRYRAEGREADAARLERMEAATMSKLDRARVKRREKVYGIRK